MNKVVLIGRLVKDCELKFIPSTGMAVVNFRIAINRNFKQAEGNPKADFIPIILFGKLAESLSSYLIKGKQVAVGGRIQTRSYEKDGKKTYVTEVVASDITLLGGSKNESGKGSNSSGFNGSEGFTNVTGEDDGDIPF